MSIVKILELKFVSTHTNNVNFQRDKNVDENVALGFNIQSILSENVSDKDECKLTFMCDVKGINKPIDELSDIDPEHYEFDFTIDLAVDYFFKITDRDAFEKLSEQDVNEYCSNVVYLDFRRKIIMLVSSIGIGNFRMPLSLSQLKRDDEEAN